MIKVICPTEQIKERANICKTCEHLTKVKTCAKCGCNIYLKVTLAFEKCPQGKWNAIK